VRLLIAEDDRTTSHLLTRLASTWGYEVVACRHGLEALAILAAEAAPELAVLDWMLPEMDGPEICRRLRAYPRTQDSRPYVLMLTSRTGLADVVEGLDAGADDYLTKPFSASELSARLRAGARTVQMHQRLVASVGDLAEALGSVRRLTGLLPICAYCKSIRDDSDYWQGVERYLSEHSDVEFTHGICPRCAQRIEEGIQDYR